MKRVCSELRSSELQLLLLICICDVIAHHVSSCAVNLGHRWKSIVTLQGIWISYFYAKHQYITHCLLTLLHLLWLICPLLRFLRRHRVFTWRGTKEIMHFKGQTTQLAPLADVIALPPVRCREMSDRDCFFPPFFHRIGWHSKRIKTSESVSAFVGQEHASTRTPSIASPSSLFCFFLKHLIAKNKLLWGVSLGEPYFERQPDGLHCGCTNSYRRAAGWDMWGCRTARSCQPLCCLRLWWRAGAPRPSRSCP